MFLNQLLNYVIADLDALKSIFSNLNKFIQAVPFPFLLMTLTVFAFGVGVFSIDWLIGKKFSKKSGDT